MSRTTNSLKNIATQFLTTAVIAILGFVTRKVFIDNLGTDYLGLNGLLSEILGMLSLVEGGIGTSIVYNLYKPLAEKDESKIVALIQLYRKIYRIIALIVLVLSLVLYPFLNVFIKGGENLSYVSLVYFIFVANTLVGYFMADKLSLIRSDQKQYKLASFNIIYQIVLYLVKIIILAYYKNYVLYLVIELFFSIGYNVIIARKISGLYPFIKTRATLNVSSDVRSNIIANVKALFLHNVGGYLIHNTDNIIISSFVSISAVGLYSNFKLLTSQFSSISKSIFNSIKESVGNLVAVESVSRQFEVFKTLYFINFLVVSLIVAILYNTLNPFVSWWLGSQYNVQDSTIIAICLLFYVDEIRSSIMMYKVVSGLFVPDRYVVFITAVINIIVSILLARKYQMTGVLLGSSISLLLTASWNWPRIVYKYVFKTSPFHYYRYYLLYFVLAVIIAFSSRCINDQFFYSDGDYSLMVIIARSLIVVTVFSIVVILSLGRTTQFRNLCRLVIGLIKK